MERISQQLPPPLNGIVIEKHSGEYKDFGVRDSYPLKGVTFAAEYGYLPGYIGEDGAELDFFVGSKMEGFCGFFIVFRPDLPHGEHKFYVTMSKEELQKTLQEYKPVITAHEQFADVDVLISAIKEFETAS